MHASN